MRTLDAELTRLRKEHEFFFYADAPHAFNSSSSKGYKPDHDKTSWARTLTYFNKHLKGIAAKKAAAAG